MTSIEDAILLLRAGEIVALPSESVYGLAADALNPTAVKKIFDAKGRPADNPLIVHVASIEQAAMIVQVNDVAATLMNFWPGPLTLVMKKKSVPAITTGNLDTVAVRIPRNEIFLQIIRQVGPIAAPSANISGKPSPTTAAHVREDFPQLPIVDGGPTAFGVESTVVDTLSGQLLRKGAITKEELLMVVSLTEGSSNRSPGMKYRHYAPKAHVLVQENVQPSQMVTLAISITGKNVIKFQSVEEYAKRFYATLRECDARGVTHIVCEAVPKIGIGATLMDRLERASKRQ